MNKYLNRACREVTGFTELLQRFEHNISILGRSPRTFDSYSRYVAAMALHFQCLPSELDPEQVKDYLYELQQRSKTPSQTYFKHTVYGLRFLLKTEGLPYDFLHLPSIAREKKLPVILSREEIWRMLQSAQLLKHRLLIGLLYGCGLRCMEVRGIRLQHLDFDRRLLHIVQGKGRTSALGGHVDACDACGNISISYNSCRNRHCPKCRGHKREQWIKAREGALLPCTYYHVVFTLPQELNPLALHQPKLVYTALFRSAWETLRQFGKNKGFLSANF